MVKKASQIQKLAQESEQPILIEFRCVLLKLIARKARDVEKCKEFVVSLAKIKNGSFATIPKKRRERK